MVISSEVGIRTTCGTRVSHLPSTSAWTVRLTTNPFPTSYTTCHSTWLSQWTRLPIPRRLLTTTKMDLTMEVTAASNNAWSSRVSLVWWSPFLLRSLYPLLLPVNFTILKSSSSPFNSHLFGLFLQWRTPGVGVWLPSSAISPQETCWLPQIPPTAPHD